MDYSKAKWQYEVKVITAISAMEIIKALKCAIKCNFSMGIMKLIIQDHTILPIEYCYYAPLSLISTYSIPLTMRGC